MDSYISNFPCLLYVLSRQLFFASGKCRYMKASLIKTHTVSYIKAPSANTMSPGKSFLNKPELSVRYLSLTLPPHAFDINEIKPCGVTPMRNLTVSWCLQLDHVIALAIRLDGLSVNISKQSIMTATFLPKLRWKTTGMVACSSSCSGHWIKNLSLKDLTCIHPSNTLFAVGTDILNR